MTSQPGEQRITTHILLNISRINRKSQGKFFFFKIYAENDAGKLVPDHFLIYKKALF